MERDSFSTRYARGHVRGRWTSQVLPELEAYDVHNTLSYSAADVLAEAYGGDSTHIPKYVGFIYSDDPNAVLDPISRDMSLETIRRQVEAIRGNMLVVRFSRKPTVTTDILYDESNDLNDSNDQGGGPYNGNVVEFHAVTRSNLDGVYFDDTSGDSQFAGPLTSGKAIHRAVLLGDGRDMCGDGDRYTVLAMVDLKKNGKYRKKPEDYELALDWRVTFE